MARTCKIPITSMNIIYNPDGFKDVLPESPPREHSPTGLLCDSAEWSLSCSQNYISSSLEHHAAYAFCRIRIISTVRMNSVSVIHVLTDAFGGKLIVTLPAEP